MFFFFFRRRGGGILQVGVVGSSSYPRKHEHCPSISHLSHITHKCNLVSMLV